MEFLHTLLVFITTNPAGVGVAIGAVTPVIISILSQPRFSQRARTVLAIGVSVVLGAVLTLSNSNIEGPVDYFALITSLYATCETFYQRIYKASGLAAAIEAATSRKPADSEGLPVEAEEGDEAPVG